MLHIFGSDAWGKGGGGGGAMSKTHWGHIPIENVINVVVIVTIADQIASETYVKKSWRM